MAHIFISYHSGSRDYVLRLADALRSSNYEVWLDVDTIPGSAQWVKTIRDGIENASVVLIVMTSAGEDSSWVQREQNYAEQLGKPILPLQREGRIWFSLSNLQSVDARACSLDNPIPPNLIPALTPYVTGKDPVISPLPLNTPSQPVSAPESRRPSKRGQMAAAGALLLAMMMIAFVVSLIVAERYLQPFTVDSQQIKALEGTVNALETAVRVAGQITQIPTAIATEQLVEGLVEIAITGIEPNLTETTFLVRVQTVNEALIDRYKLEFLDTETNTVITEFDFNTPPYDTLEVPMSDLQDGLYDMTLRAFNDEGQQLASATVEVQLMLPTPTSSPTPQTGPPPLATRSWNSPIVIIVIIVAAITLLLLMLIRRGTAQGVLSKRKAPVELLQAPTEGEVRFVVTHLLEEHSIAEISVDLQRPSTVEEAVTILRQYVEQLRGLSFEVADDTSIGINLSFSDKPRKTTRLHRNQVVPIYTDFAKEIDVTAVFRQKGEATESADAS